MEIIRKRSPGILLAFIIAAIAWQLGKWAPIVGSPVFGILIGMIIATWQRPKYFDAGINYTSKKLLKLAIILIGFNMNLVHVLAVGRQTLVLMFFTLSATFLTAYLAGRWLKIERNANILIGVGTAICGGSAIAATAPVIDADDSEVASAISTIFLFNVIAAFAFPAMGHFFGMTDHFFGLWAGTAINDTSSVVAAGYAYSSTAGDLAVIVKLTRTLMIIPVTLVLAIYQSKKDAASHKISVKGIETEMHSGSYHLVSIFPWFVLGFLAAAFLNTVVEPMWEGWIPAAHQLAVLGKFMIVMAMAAIGLNTHLGKLVRNGIRPLILGFTTWVVLAVVSILVQVTLQF
ncbi:YeiH family protein [Fusibacter paucivorans]|uniref:YeiH family protein n=1 Tax=Fusibacter paucivorans TaxID=76009 RepID=UPI001FE484DB|nr:YeiH family protein [Fusibacter paucivorans]